MSLLNQGRNEIRFNNSDGKCLLENWVEEVGYKFLYKRPCIYRDVYIRPWYLFISIYRILLQYPIQQFIMASVFIMFIFSSLQRQVADYDKIDKDEKITSSAQIFRDGHSGILTTELDARVDNVTTVRHSYKKPEPCGVRLVGNGIKNYRSWVADVITSCTENIFKQLFTVIQPIFQVIFTNTNLYVTCVMVKSF